MGHIRISSEPCGSRTYAYFIFRFVPFSRLTKRKKLYAKRQRTAELGRDFPDMTGLSARNVKRRIFRKTMPPPDNPDQIVGRHY